MARRINAPGIEVNEIDRSGYEETVDNSTIGTATLVLGFADKGDDYSVKWMNTMNTFVRTYGTPSNDAERYFYNSVFEILDRGGVCYTAKLPYSNNSLDNFTYTSYTIEPEAKYISSATEIVGSLISTEFLVPSSDYDESQVETYSQFTLKDYLFSPFTHPDIYETAFDPEKHYTLPQMEDFVEFLKKNVNFSDSD